MSAERKSPRRAWSVLLLAGLSGGGLVLADEQAEEPDLEFLEYLGSWEAGEEDWLIFAGDREATADTEDEEKEETAPDGEKLAEVKDEE